MFTEEELKALKLYCMVYIDQAKRVDNEDIKMLERIKEEIKLQETGKSLLHHCLDADYKGDEI